MTAVTAGTVVDGETRIASAALTTVAADAAGPAGPAGSAGSAGQIAARPPLAADATGPTVTEQAGVAASTPGTADAGVEQWHRRIPTIAAGPTGTAVAVQQAGVAAGPASAGVHADAQQ